MSESESDPELNVSQYDLEDDLNVYGSPAYRSPTAQEAAAVGVPLPADDGRTQVSLLLLSLIVSYIYIINS